MIKARFKNNLGGKQEIELSSTNHNKTMRVFHTVDKWGFKHNNNGTTVWFNSYQEGLTYLDKKGW